MIQRHLVRGLASKLLCALISVSSSFSWGALQVYPTRVLLNDAKQVTNISLRHFGEKESSYRISTVFYRMKSDGNMEPVENPSDSERPLTKYLKFSPRVVTLAPRGEQVVRVVYRGPKDLPEGEYRAHLHFEPTEAESGAEVIKLKGENNINITLQAKIAVAVPVIFTHGKPSYETKLSSLQVVETKEKKPAISVDMSSSGSAYPFGDFVATFTPKGGKPEVVAVARSIASYLPQRSVMVPQVDEKAKKFSGGKLRVEFREAVTSGDGKVITSIERELP